MKHSACDRLTENSNNANLRNEINHSEFLLSVTDLASSVNDPSLRLIDVRKEEEYAKSHVPGAVNLPVKSLDRIIVLDNGNVVESVLKPPKEIEVDFQKVGIDCDSRIVVYDQNGRSHATRLWWALDYHSHPKISILDGGFIAWENAGSEVTAELSESPQGRFEPSPIHNKIADFECVKSQVGSNSTIICNALSAERHAKESIPSSINLPAVSLVYDSYGTNLIKPADELRMLFSKCGITSEKEVIFYCGHGYAASLNFYVARMLGFEKIRNYDGSLADWKAHNADIQTGDV